MNQDFNLEEAQKRLMEVLVSRTLKKHGVNKGENSLSEKEKQSLREAIQHLQQQTELLLNSEKHVTESDVDPVTNTYVVKQEKK